MYRRDGIFLSVAATIITAIYVITWYVYVYG